MAKTESRQDAEMRGQIMAALKANKGYRQLAADALGISLRTLHRRISSLGMSAEIQKLEQKLGRRTWAPNRKATPLKARSAA